MLVYELKIKQLEHDLAIVNKKLSVTQQKLNKAVKTIRLVRQSASLYLNNHPNE